MNIAERKVAQAAKEQAERKRATEYCSPDGLFAICSKTPIFDEQIALIRSILAKQKQSVKYEP